MSVKNGENTLSVVNQDLTNISLAIDGVVIQPEIYQAGVIEQRYRALYNDLLVLLTVRQWPDGTRWARFAVENGYVNKTTQTKKYRAVVTIGSVVLDQTIEQYAHTRWVADGWIGEHAEARQDIDYLKSTGLVPNYLKSAKAVPGWYQAYNPGEVGNHTVRMGEAGYQNQIGIMPRWDAAYISSGSEDAYRSVMANAKAIGTYSIVWRDYDTLETIDLDKFAQWTVDGYKQGGETIVVNPVATWERAHFPSTGYLAYLLTGDPTHLDSLAHTAALCYLVQNWYGGGLGRERLSTGETRAQAWCWRSIGMYTALTDDDDFNDMLSFNFSHYAKVINANTMGVSYIGNINAYGTGIIAPWMQNFRVQVLGFLSDIDPVDNIDNLIKLRDFNYKFPVGLLQNICRAGDYTLKAAPDDAKAIEDLYDWDDIPESECNNTISRPNETSYWANLLPAISYAIKHQAPGAKEAWGRVEKISNYQQWRDSFKTNTVWAIFN